MACLFHFISAAGAMCPRSYPDLYNLPYMLWLHVRPGRARIYLFALLFLLFLFSKFPRHPLWSFVIGIIRQGISFTFQNLAACT